MSKNHLYIKKNILASLIICLLISDSITASITYTIVQAGNASSFISALSTANGKASASSRQYIFLPNGQYDLGTKIKTQISSYVSIIGQSRDKVIIKNQPTQEGISTTATLYTTGSDIYMQDITINCRANNNGSGKLGEGRGVAWWDHGTKNILKNVRLDGTQDTYWSNGSQGMVGYFESGIVMGTVDFICGSGSIFFNSVNIYCANINTRTKGDVITAPSTYDSEKGYVFKNCVIKGESSQNGNYNLGRPWHNSPGSTWLNTKFDINPSAAGWTSMSNGLKLRFHEFESTSGGKVVKSHNLNACQGAANSDQLYISSANGYDIKDVLGAWAQTATNNAAQVNAPSPKCNDKSLSWGAVNGASAYLIEKDGAFVGITNSNTYKVSDLGSYTVRSANAMGGFGNPSAVTKC